jgi:hypothetical protein
LPAESELSDISKAESADDISEKIGIGFVEVGVHHRALGPIYQFRLAEFAVKVFSNLIGTIWRVIMFRSRVGEFSARLRNGATEFARSLNTFVDDNFGVCDSFGVGLAVGHAAG